MQQEFIEDSIPGLQDIQSDLAVWDQIAADAEAEYAAMSAEDKERLAQLLDANSEWIQRLENAMLNTSFYLSNKFTESDYTKQDCRDLINDGQLEQIEGNTFTALALGIEAYWCGLTFEERQYEDVSNDFERGVLLMEDVEFDPGPGLINTVTNLVVRKMDALTKELQGLYSSNGIADELLDVDNKVQSELILRNGYPEPIFAQIRFRSMTANDVNASGQIGQSATFFSTIINNYNDVLESVDRPLIWRPEFTQTTVIKEFNRFLSVPQQSVSNSDVILVNTQIVDDNWELVFGKLIPPKFATT